MNADGTFSQVEVTTQGVSGPLVSKGTYPAALCCNLYNAKRKDKRNKRAIITAKNGESYVTRISDGTVIGYKYFDFCSPKEISVTVRGGEGEMLVLTEKNGEPIARVIVAASENWRTFSAPLQPVEDIKPLYLVWQGDLIEFVQFTLR